MLLAALVAFAAARGDSGGSGRRYVVAARDLAIGATLTEADLRTSAVDLTDDLAGHSFTDIAPLVGTVTVAPIAKGELVQRSQVIASSTADAGYQVPLPLDRSRALGGDLRAGEHVDVLATYGSGTTAVTLVVARRATVVRVASDDEGGLGSSGQISVVLSVKADEYLGVTHASQVGKVTIVRPTGAAPDQPPADEYHPPIGDNVRDVDSSSGNN